MHVVVLGGGVSGLSAAFWLRRLAPTSVVKRITLLEASPQRVGGWLCSVRSPKGHLFEEACRSFRPRGRTARPLLQLIASIDGLEDEALPASKAAQRRYLYAKGGLSQVPDGPLALARWPLLRGKLGMLRRDLKTSPGQSFDEDVQSFFTRRFGSALAQTVIDPVVSGIYAGDVAQLSAKSLFPQLFALERSHGSILAAAMRDPKALTSAPTSEDDAREEAAQDQAAGIGYASALESAGSLSFRNGVSQLTDALRAALEADPTVNVQLGRTVSTLRCGSSDPSSSVEVIHSSSTSKDGETPVSLDADRVISALPAANLAAALPPAAQEAVTALQSIPRASVAAVNVAWRSDVLTPRGLSGFGYLVPTSLWEYGGVDSDDTQPSPKSSRTADDTILSPSPSSVAPPDSPRGVIPGVLGMTWDSCVFPGHDSRFGHADETKSHSREVPTRVTAMLGGAKFPEVATMDDGELEMLALLAVREQLGVEDVDPDEINVSVARNAIPQYNVGHADRVATARSDLRKHLPRVDMIGNSFDGVGVADCVFYAKQTARDVLASALRERAD